MTFMNVHNLKTISFDEFEAVNVGFLERLKRNIEDAASAGNVSVKVSFYSHANKDMSVEHRETLVSYLCESGFKATYLNKELTVFWGVAKH